MSFPTVNIVSDSLAIPFRPQFKKVLGTTNAALLFQQCLYWWGRSGYTPFFKFKEACAHPLYKEGDSWCEELCMTKREFDGAISRLKELGLVSWRRDNNNKLWYSMDNIKVNDFLHLAFNEPPKDLLCHIEGSDLNEIASSIDTSSTTFERKYNALLNAVRKGKHSPLIAFKSIIPIPEITNCYLSHNNMLLSSNKRLLQIFFLNGLKTLEEKACINSVKPKEEKTVNAEDLAKKMGGNMAFAQQLQKVMPKPKAGAKPAFGQVLIAWKSSYGEISNSFCGGLTRKDEALLKHIFKDYPNDAAAIVKHCVFEWATFRNTVIRDKGLSNAPSVPTISFLSTYREIAHKVYTGGETTQVDSPQPTNLNETEQLGLTSADDFLRNL